MKLLQHEQKYLYGGSTINSHSSALVAYFKISYLSKILLKNTTFSALWDTSKIQQIRPGFGFRRKKNGLQHFRKSCGTSGRYGSRNRLTGLSRFQTKLMMERGILPGMYGAGW